MLAYAAYRDDKAQFESALALALARMDVMSQPDGEIVETCRDTHHPQYSLVCWMEAAELANNLGYPGLYEAKFDGQKTPRLAIILEYFAKMMLGNAPHPCGSGWGYDYNGEYDRFDNYEVGYNHYINRQHVDFLPAFKTLVENYWRKNVGSDSHFLLWSRLTHGENVATTVSLAPYRSQGRRSPVGERMGGSARANLDISVLFSVDGRLQTPFLLSGNDYLYPFRIGTRFLAMKRDSHRVP